METERTGCATPSLHDAQGIVQIARAWIGTPYVHQASVKGAGCDCLGLLRGVFREMRGEEPETPPPYSPDWAEATGTETLYSALLRHLTEIDIAAIAPGDIALFRMAPRGPAKHCGIIGWATASLLERGDVGRATASLLERGDVGRATASLLERGGLTLIHARQNKRVSEEHFSPLWHRKLAFAFRL
jgi:NlpC/P60 family putative phage cell wall peptidase